MPKEDLFLDNVAEYRRWIDQGYAWPHVVDDDRPGPRNLGVDPQPITEMSPQHAVSALHKAHRWYDWLEINRRFIVAGEGADNVMIRRHRHHTSPLVKALTLRAIGDTTWRYHFDQSLGSGDLSEDDILEVAIDTMTELDRLDREHPVKVSPTRKILILRDTLTRSIAQKREDTA
jgi:hypothetical protein